jgi:hypothetical protein
VCELLNELPFMKKRKLGIPKKSTENNLLGMVKSALDED